MNTAGFESEGSTRPSPDDAIAEPVPMDTTFMLLKNQRRREVLRYLVRTEPETTLDALARHIAARENGIDERALSSSQRKRVYIGLYQAHLPKMDDVGVIDFDKHRGRVELRPEAEQLFKYLWEPDATPNPRSYLGASLTLGMLASVAALDLVAVPGLSLLVMFAVGGVTVHAVYTGRTADQPRANSALTAVPPTETDGRVVSRAERDEGGGDE